MAGESLTVGGAQALLLSIVTREECDIGGQLLMSTVVCSTSLLI